MNICDEIHFIQFDPSNSGKISHSKTTNVCAENHGKCWTDYRVHPYSRAVVWSVTKAEIKIIYIL